MDILMGWMVFINDLTFGHIGRARRGFWRRRYSWRECRNCGDNYSCDKLEILVLQFPAGGVPSSREYWGFGYRCSKWRILLAARKFHKNANTTAIRWEYDMATKLEISLNRWMTIGWWGVKLCEQLNGWTRPVLLGNDSVRIPTDSQKGDAPWLAKLLYNSNKYGISMGYSRYILQFMVVINQLIPSGSLTWLQKMVHIYSWFTS